MKTVYYIKDSYQNNSFRVSYYEKNSIKKNISFDYNEKTGDVIQTIKEVLYDKLVFCQRLEWSNNENELDSYIEEVRLYWENRINM